MITNFVMFLEGADEEILDPDAAVEMLETLGYDLDQLDRAFLRELIDAFAVVALEHDEETAKSVRSIPSGFYLEELLAEDDPVAMAKLDAIRAAAD
ncbi:hypothetical protein ACT009_09720 [Sphingomonas sp. Tas61C01]|uniref:hypothetical protein n=1 Tax=Sphingomonas sp. Tas61C01 TaxID=3458297 RepID=UPI00403E73E0